MRKSSREREPSFLLSRTVREIRCYSAWMRWMRLAAVSVACLLLTVYFLSVLYRKTGSFTVSVDRQLWETYALTLCETPDFASSTGVLNAQVSKHITNISVSDLPDDLDRINGAHSGDNYLAYTFYLQNAGREAVGFEYRMVLANVTQELDSALRVRLYVDGEMTTYAKTRSDGSGPEEGCAEFLTQTTVVRGQIEAFAPGDIHQFTVVMWLEGNDADCVDALIGGTLKAEMTFSVIEHDLSFGAIGT